MTAVRKEYSATARQIPRSIRSVRQACSSAAPGGTGALLFGPVGVAHGHPDHHDRVDDGGQGHHPGNPPPGAYDHRAVHTFSEYPIGCPHVVTSGRRHGGRLQSQADPPHGRRRLVNDDVVRPSPIFQGQIETFELDRDAEHGRLHDPQRLLEKLLSRLVAFADHQTCTSHGLTLAHLITSANSVRRWPGAPVSSVRSGSLQPKRPWEPPGCRPRSPVSAAGAKL